MIAFDNWPVNSKLPLAHYKSTIGTIGDLKTEGDVILLEHNVEFRSFSKAVLDCLPLEDLNWKIPQAEYESRLDLRHVNVCSIDPPGK
jgi:exosome complex exonuclease DIS3/RRP44